MKQEGQEKLLSWPFFFLFSWEHQIDYGKAASMVSKR